MKTYKKDPSRLIIWFLVIFQGERTGLKMDHHAGNSWHCCYFGWGKSLTAFSAAMALQMSSQYCFIQQSVSISQYGVDILSLHMLTMFKKQDIYKTSWWRLCFVAAFFCHSSKYFHQQNSEPKY